MINLYITIYSYSRDITAMVNNNKKNLEALNKF